MIIDKNIAKIDFFPALYEQSRSYSEELFKNLTKYYAQYKGSSEIDESDVKSKHVRNITYELIESQVTSYLPRAAVTPKKWSETNERNAKSIETLLRNKRDELPFEKLNDIDERFNPIYGGSVWLIEWDNSIVTHNTVGDIKITCLSPLRFTGQPKIYDMRDMEYCFISFETTKEDIIRRYGVSVEEVDNTQSDESTPDDSTATIIVCYYKNDEDKVCQYVWSGEQELLDIEDYYARKSEVCENCGKRKELCNCEKPKYVKRNDEFEEIDHDIARSDGSVIPMMSPIIVDGVPQMESSTEPVITEDGTPLFDTTTGVRVPLMQEVLVPKMQPTKLPYYAPNILPVVIRKNTSEEDRLFGQSDCEFIRPQQQAINKLESRILEKIMNSGVYATAPEDFQGQLDNDILGKVIPVTQANKLLFGTIDIQTNVQQDTQAAERMYDHAKRIIGISDSFQGQYDSSAQSGKAKQIQVQQAAGRLESKRQMKNAAYAEIDQIIFQYYLAYADEPRPSIYKDAQGRLQNREFNRYDFLEVDDAGEYYYNDQYLFSCDATVDAEKQREFLWQENRANFTAGAYGDPQQPETQLIFWQNMESAHYPWAHDNVERIKEQIRQLKLIQELQTQNTNLQHQVERDNEYEAYQNSLIKEIQNGN